MATFAELLAELNDDEITARLVHLYPDQEGSIEGYRAVLAKLRALSPAETALKLDLRPVVGLDGETQIDVCGVEDRTYYAIEHTPWSQWLAMHLTARTLGGFGRLDIAAHALWEMTWCGFDESDGPDTLAGIVTVADDRVACCGGVPVPPGG